MRCAIIHYWLLGMRGGEKVIESLCRLFPEADIYTLFYDASRVSPLITSHRVTASFLNPFKGQYRSLLPLMPLALESWDLRDYDLIISSESGPAKGVIVPSRARHICYCHSPMRYLWDLYPGYRNEWTHSPVKRMLMVPLSNYLRVWDYASAARVDEFVANSRNVEQRIWKTYRRRSEVIYPPVAVNSFVNKPAEDYYLVVSELVAYKRIGDAVRGLAKIGRRLKVVGDGPEYKALKALAGGSVEFCGRVADFELRELYARCRAVLLPGEEDFGIVPVEAIASGKPVIALGCGGVLESVPQRNPQAGFFYDEPGAEHLMAAVEQFEREEARLSSAAIQRSAQRFSEMRFESEMRRLIFANLQKVDTSPTTMEVTAS